MAFVPSTLIYGPCRPSRLSDYVAYETARRKEPCLRFLDIEDLERTTSEANPEGVTGQSNKKKRQENEQGENQHYENQQGE